MISKWISLEIRLWKLQYIYINESWFTITLSHEKSLHRVELREIMVGVGKSSKLYQFQYKPKFKPRMILILRVQRSAKISSREIQTWVRYHCNTSYYPWCTYTRALLPILWNFRPLVTENERILWPRTWAWPNYHHPNQTSTGRRDFYLRSLPTNHEGHGRKLGRPRLF